MLRDISYICYTEEDFIDCQKKKAFSEGYVWVGNNTIRTLDNLKCYKLPVVLHLYESFGHIGWDKYDEIIGDIEYTGYVFVKYVSRKRKLNTILK